MQKKTACQAMVVLEIQNFTVLVPSCDGPYAATSAFSLPEQVTKLVLVGTVGRFDIPSAERAWDRVCPIFGRGRYAPWLSRLQLRMIGQDLAVTISGCLAATKLGEGHFSLAKTIAQRS